MAYFGGSAGDHVVSLGLGIVGGATGTQVWGVLGAVLVGAAVGWAIKFSYFTLLSGPVGFVVGALVGLLLWALGLGKRRAGFPDESVRGGCRAGWRAARAVRTAQDLAQDPPVCGRAGRAGAGPGRDVDRLGAAGRGGDLVGE